MYDFANSGYTTVVITAVFAAYFVGGVAGGAPWATLAWTSALSTSYLIVMLTMPGLGAWADRVAGKRRLLMWVTAGCVISTAALALVGPGQVALGLLILVISNTFFSYGESLTASFLPELAQPQAMGRVSGWGWAVGYIGGMLTLGVCLAYVLAAQARGETGGQFVPVTMLITASVYGVAACVTFVLMREHAKPQPDAPVVGMLASLQGLAQTFRAARPYKDFTRLMACAVAYQGGVAVAIGAAGRGAAGRGSGRVGLLGAAQVGLPEAQAVAEAVEHPAQGEVLEAEAASGFAPGDRVMGGNKTGAFAEYAVVPARSVSPMPHGIGYPAAAALGAVYGGAYLWMLIGIVRVIFFPSLRWLPDYINERRGK